ncbi:hypothetical protein HY631_03155 [Candidatus Uhrbacteria bacterium]|nr:hypothetical protein [Candidatus Uhrbacteria bacterium]
MTETEGINSQESKAAEPVFVMPPGRGEPRAATEGDPGAVVEDPSVKAAQARAQERAAALAELNFEDYLEGEEMEDVDDLPEYDEEGNVIPRAKSPKGFLPKVLWYGGRLDEAAVMAGVMKEARWYHRQTLSLTDRLALKLSGWGDKLLQSSGVPFAKSLGGGLDWLVGLFVSEKSLAELIDKERKEKLKARKKVLEDLRKEREKMEKKQDAAAKKKKGKEEKKRKLKKIFGEKAAEAIEEATESDEEENGEEEKKEKEE